MGSRRKFNRQFKIEAVRLVTEGKRKATKVAFYLEIVNYKKLVE